jgi:chemotaxis protein MotB
MQMKRYFLVGMTALIMLGLMASGCAVNFYKQSPRSKKQIKELQSRIDDLEAQRREERKRFEEAKRMLEGKLKDDKRISLEVDERGLVIILSDDILFDSGKAEIKKKAYPILDNVASVVKKKVPDKNIGVTGHTDNVPITYSKWESNWELSTARATNVLHYLESRGIPPKKLSATGYGEHHPIESNATAEGRAKNRRVEIVILPEFEKKKQGDVLSGTGKESIK